jgi:hypothetical protein
VKEIFVRTLMTVSAVALTTTASAAPMGLLQLSSGGTGVVVTATTIDWLPAGGGVGTMVTDAGTNVIYTGGALVGGGVPGTITDLPPVPTPNFMTFAGHPLVFGLSGIGPGSANDCGNPGSGFVASGSCSFTAFGSPFILTVIDSDTTSVALGAFGLVTEGDGFSNWDGSFSTQLQLSVAQIYDAIYAPGGRGFVQSGYSGEFDVEITQVPEPASMILLGLGVTAAAVRLRRRR